jgi:processive 1,2-diacylglycerol beta-glucosyltransferase
MDRMVWSGGQPGKVAVPADWSRNKTILFVSENFGSGHTKAAEALAKGIEEKDPEIRVQLVELGRHLRPQVNQALLYSYLGMIKKAPFIWRKVYGRHHERSFPRWLQWCLHQTLYSSLSKYIAQYQPQVVVSTHPFASSGVARLKRAGFPLQLVTVITDFSAHGSWVHPEVDLYLAPSTDVMRQLMQMGVHPARIAVTGIPTESRFWEGKDSDEARKQLGLKQLPTVLILGGGLGLGRTDHLARMAAKWKGRLQFLYCTGRNTKLLETLRQNPELQHPHVRLIGYTESVDQWMDAADVVLTKPGGMTCTEAIAKGKPLLLYGSIPGHEEENSRFLEKHGLAEKLKNEEDLDQWMQRLVQDPQCLQEIRENMLCWRWNIHPSKSVDAVHQLMTSSSVR